jgi:hypothetical protein
MPRKKTATPSLGSASVVPVSLGSSVVDTLHNVGHVHETVEGVSAITLSPPHPPREDTPEYRQTHQLLVFDKDTPCKVCGVRRSTLDNPTKNTVGATDIETHHFPVALSLLDAVDWRKVHNDFPAVYNQHSLEVWVNSPQNMLVLCDIHHRGTETGIHHLPTEEFSVMPYLFDGYRVAATAKDATVAAAQDEKIEQAVGIEQRVDAEIAATPAKPKRPRKSRSRKPTVAA